MSAKCQRLSQTRFAARHDALHQVPGEFETSHVATAVGYPRNTTERALEDLVAHNIASVNRGGKGKANTWTLTAWAAQRYAAALTFPETSHTLFKDPDHIEEDISGEVATSNGQPPLDADVEHDRALAKQQSWEANP